MTRRDKILSHGSLYGEDTRRNHDRSQNVALLKQGILLNTCSTDNLCLTYTVINLGKGKQGKAVPVKGREGPWGCETSMLPHFLGIRLTSGGEVVSPTRRPPFTPRKIPGTHFC
jgi:hypothetical protein